MLEFLKRTFAIYFVFWLIALPAFGDEEIVEIKEGETAPFSGTLLNDKVAAQLLVGLSTAEEKCKIYIEKEVKKTSAALQYEIDICAIRLSTEKSLRVEQNKIKDEHITNLQKLTSAKRFPNEAWFVLGTLTGVGITVAAGYAIGNISQ